MKILILLLQDQDCLSWNIYASIFNKNDKDLEEKIRKLAYEVKPYAFKNNIDFKIEFKSFEGYDHIDGWVYTTYLGKEYPTGKEKIFRHYIFAIMVDVIDENI